MAKTVLEKMGFKPGMTGWVRDLPDALTKTLSLPDALPEDRPDLILSFVTRQDGISPALAAVLPHYARGKSLWFAYPKKSGKVSSDVSRDHGWETLLAADFLPVTQIALDENWSALRFRYRDEISKLTRKSGTHNPQAA